MSDDAEVTDLSNAASGKWFLLALEHGLNDDRTLAALERARAHGMSPNVEQWVRSTGLAMAHEMDS